MKPSEDHDVYVEIDQDHLHSAEDSNRLYLELIGLTILEQSPAVETVDIATNPNPSYELLTGDV